MFWLTGLCSAPCRGCALSAASYRFGHSADFLHPAEARTPSGDQQPASCVRTARLALHWKVYRVFYSFCDLAVSYCYVPQASHAQLRSMLVDADRGRKNRRVPGCGNGLIVWTAHMEILSSPHGF